MKCPSCGTRNPRKNKFCKACGEELLHATMPTPAGATTTIIIEEKRGIPGFVWVLVGVVLVLVLSGLLVWLDIVDVPHDLRVRLPDPIGEIVDALENARNPGGVAAANPPANQGGPPPQVQPGNQLPAACDEDLITSFGIYELETCTGRAGVIWLKFKSPLVSASYDVTVAQFGNTIYKNECPVWSENRLPICDWDCFRWDPGELIITLKPAGLDCLVGRFVLDMQ